MEMDTGLGTISPSRGCSGLVTASGISVRTLDTIYNWLFSDRVGHNGRVFAFEPSPLNHSKLVANCADLINVNIFKFGIGDHDRKVNYQQGDDVLVATTRVLSSD